MIHAIGFLWIGRGREREILKGCRSHLRKVLGTVVEMNHTIQAFCDLNRKDSDRSYRGVFRNEREADELKRELLTELSGGIIHPLNREGIIRLVMTADDVATNAKAAARKLNAFVDPKKIPQGLRETLRKFSESLVGISTKTYETFIALEKDPKSAVALSNEVERMEELIDDFRADELIPKLLATYGEIKDIGLSMLLKEVTDNMEYAADYCEDVCDIIRCLAVS